MTTIMCRVMLNCFLCRFICAHDIVYVSTLWSEPLVIFRQIIIKLHRNYQFDGQQCFDSKFFKLTFYKIMAHDP